MVPGARCVVVPYVRGGGYQLPSSNKDLFAVPLIEAPTEHLALTQEGKLDRSRKENFRSDWTYKHYYGVIFLSQIYHRNCHL